MPGKLVSIFSQKLDRAAFTAYFLGAVVPLLALAVVVERFVLPSVEDSRETFGLIGAVISIAVLSLSSFLILRRTTRRSLARMERDNHRLARLLEASSAFGAAQHPHDAASRAAASAVAIAGAEGAFVMVRSEKHGQLTLLESAGPEARRLAGAREKLLELGELVAGGGETLLHGPGAAKDVSAVVVVPIPGEGAPLGALAVTATGAGREFEETEVGALATLAALLSASLRNADLRDAQRNFFSHVTDILVSALDAHLGYNPGHSHRVAQLANRVGRELHLDEDRMQRLHFAALLHDIGMLKLDRAMQMNAKTCAKHAVIGYRMLDRIRLWQDIAPLVHHHHERFDGSGYPEGLQGEDIPLESRIIALCDAVDAMSSPHSYKTALSHDECLREVREGAGTQFDPRIAQAFVALLERGAIDLPA